MERPTASPKQPDKYWQEYNVDINEIASRAINVKKPNKAKAFSMLKRIIEDATDSKTSYNLAELYSYFLPPVPRRPKTAEIWINKAVAKQDIRYYLNQAYSTGKLLIGTDGHRMHTMPTDLPEGFYNSDGAKTDLDAKYPDIKKVMPKGRAKKFEFLGNIRDLESNGRAAEVAPGVWVNHQYLLDMLSYSEEVKIFARGSDDAVRFDFPDGRKAVIMPMRV